MLAALGGQPLIDSAELPHGRYPPVGSTERAWLERALGADRLWGPWGPHTRELEHRWAQRTGVRFCAAVNSGTAALHCAVVGSGVLPGDEVIVPAFTFIATASAVMMAGAIPVFADVEAATGNLAPASVQQRITDRTRAIVAVHLHGQPADMDALGAIARERRIPLIEDCAQAHGAHYRGTAVGALGTVGAFSLNATKLLAGPEGGLMTTDHVDIYDRAARLRVFGVTHREGRAVVRNTDCLGYSYRTNELMSAFALARLEAFDDEQETRVQNARALSRGLAGLPGVEVPTEFEGSTHVYQLYRIRLDPVRAGVRMPHEAFRARLLSALCAEGARFWTWETRSLPEYDIFRTRNAAGGGFPWTLRAAETLPDDRPDLYPIARAIARDAIYTNSHFPPNGAALMEAYVSCFRKVWEHLDDLQEIPLQPPSQEGEVEDFTE